MTADRPRRPARYAAEPGSSPRLAHLDNLRTTLVAWVIGGHALLGYSAVGGWAYDEVREVAFAPATELVLVAVLGPSGLFVIGLFFFIAGLFVERAVARQGPGRYARERLVRLGVPWLVSALLVWPASVWLALTVNFHKLPASTPLKQRIGSGRLSRIFLLVILFHAPHPNRQIIQPVR